MAMYKNEDNGMVTTVTVYNQREIIRNLNAKLGDSITSKQKGKLLLLQVVEIKGELRLSPN